MAGAGWRVASENREGKSRDHTETRHPSLATRHSPLVTRYPSPVTRHPSPATTKMSVNSKIEWTDATWNPIRGCTKISPGCAHCYAETFAERFRGVAGHPYEQGFDLKLIPEKLAEPLRWATPKMVFVNSMSDLFHEDVRDDYIEQVCQVMVQAALAHVPGADQAVGANARHAAHPAGRSRRGSRTSGSGSAWRTGSTACRGSSTCEPRPPGCGCSRSSPCSRTLVQLDLSGIGWVIAGGESGPGARPMEADWVRSVRDQCRSAGVPFFFKQWGGVRKNRSGRVLDGRTHDERPERDHE